MRDLYGALETTALGVWLREVTLAFPLIEVIHVIAITIFLGSLYTVNFRILGFVLKSRPVSEVAKGLTPWVIGGAILTAVTGLTLLSSEALKMYDNPMWPYKTWLLIGGVVTQLAVSFYFTRPGNAEAHPAPAKLFAFLSTILWLGTGFSARYIAFV